MKFSYKARTKEGRVQKGSIEASSRKAALDVLEKYGFYVTSLKKEGKVNLLRMDIGFGKRLPRRDLVVFTRQMSTMLKSAIPPLEAFRALVIQTDNAQFREKVLKMAESIETGNSLSQAFGLYPKVFNSFFVSIVKSGEATGKVADSLTYLADHLEREHNFNQKVLSAMLYPAFVIAVFIGAGLVVMLFVVPKLTEVLKSFSGSLPWATRLLIFFTDFISKGGWVAIPILAIPLAISPFYIKRSKKARVFFHTYSLRLPLLGSFFKKIYLSRFAENLSVLISAGLPITQALKITREIITNTLYKEALRKAEERVARGDRINSVLSREPKLFPPFVTQMVATGEETGQLNKTLMEMVKFYQGDIERTTEKLITLLEPLLILVLGLGIAVLAFAVFVPLFQMGMGGGGGF